MVRPYYHQICFDYEQLGHQVYDLPKKRKFIRCNRSQGGRLFGRAGAR